ncbi:Eco57I restriction-modification methylase domain-containing protein [Lewinella sp. IMCC34191]|uniref:Eco57I restriction-modification methylase domain-containing protein n=1 Tax=Lewinella sp. IMCC34191 TaxID=2259172 RepID=UPI0018E559CF|nr:Eco57I restriction-modification methylase domain-containing protein [Lewinella sp. IMCC34191]
MPSSISSPDLFSAQQYYTELDNAVAEMALASGEERGAVFTKSCVVDLILDLVGYTPDRQLHRFNLLEPSCGTGRFFLPALDRLLISWKKAGGPLFAQSLATCLRGVELHQETFHALRRTVLNKLLEAGFNKVEAERLCDAWLIQGDFLLTQDLPAFDFVVGNPPYVRQEKIAPILLSTYRAKYRTLYDRADLYVPFIEQSLKLLKPHGLLGFICTDRWTKNKYGAPLRNMISKGYHLKAYIDLVGTQAFETDVATYPAITIITRSRGTLTQLVSKPQVSPSSLKKLAGDFSSGKATATGVIKTVSAVVNGEQPWTLDNQDQTALVRDLEARFPTLQEEGCKVGIGVATGADQVFIVDYNTLDVEPSRKLPLATTKDLNAGKVVWQGRGVVNPFEDDGTLANLETYPKFKDYVTGHQKKLKGRHVAKKSPAKWYKTIDRITSKLANQPKLLIPDIKGNASIVYEHEGLYPHHNLYYITSETWDLRALQTVLLSGVAELFVSTYSTRMRGGYLRYQAQYLRRIRIPQWEAVSEKVREQLIDASKSQDFVRCRDVVFDLYGLSNNQRSIINQTAG